MPCLISSNSRDLYLTTASASGKLGAYAQCVVTLNERSNRAQQPGENEEGKDKTMEVAN